jgi:CheY-like chemotaxis protein
MQSNHHEDRREDPPTGSLILLADDSPLMRELLTAMLDAAGHRVEGAADGREALEMLKATPFDMVVSDVHMPRLDGLSLTRAIRSDPALAHLPVVLVTSLAASDDRERGLAAGANAYVDKTTLDPADLLGTIRRWS